MPVREKDTSGCSYKGATVLNACNGAHFYPVACLDFASLYPSCMLSHNLCIESVIEDKDMIKELNRQRKAKGQRSYSCVGGLHKEQSRFRKEVCRHD